MNTPSQAVADQIVALRMRDGLCATMIARELGLNVAVVMGVLAREGLT
jgi:hypothetical protein